MNMVKKIPMYNCKKKYTSMIYKNCVYNFLFKNTIDMYNCDLKYKCKKELCNNYRFITEAKKTNEFYAIKENDNKTVYIIDKQFREIDKIILKLSDKYNQEIKGITFNRDECKILISLKNIIYSITPRGDFIKEEINKSTLLQISTSVLKQNTIRNLEGCCQKRNANILTPLITSIGFVCEQVYFSYNKDGSSYLGLLCPNGNMVQNFYIDDDI